MLFLFPAMAAAAGPGQCSAFTADLIDECYLEKFGFPATSFVPADDPVECTDEPSTGLIFKDAGIAEADAPTAVGWDRGKAVAAGQREPRRRPRADQRRRALRNLDRG